MRFINRLNIFIIFSLFLTVVFSQLLTGLLFYITSIKALTAGYQDEAAQRLETINRNVQEQIGLIDSVCTLFMSNTLIRENLDPATMAYQNKKSADRIKETERQMNSLLITHYLWSTGLVKGAYVFDTTGACADYSPYTFAAERVSQAENIYRTFDVQETELRIRLNQEKSEQQGQYGQFDQHGQYGKTSQSIYFVKNVFSIYTGKRTGTIIIEIGEEKWKEQYSTETDENHLFLMYSKDVMVNFSDAYIEPGSEKIDAIIAAAQTQTGFQTLVLDNTLYMVASERTGYADMISIVAAPRNFLMRNMNKNIQEYVFLYVFIILVSFVLTSFLGYAVTNPIKKMISYVKTVSIYQTETEMPQRDNPPKGLFVEFEEFASAFKEMLQRLEKYYADIHNQQILLKNAEIKALHAQMTPHFLFNVLNTIAWKAEISGNTDIYRMTISLSELLRANILSNDKECIPIKEELEYVFFYIQLQQYRFEDKFTVEIQCDESLYHFLTPRFSIQCLAENAISHGLEPLYHTGHLNIRIVPFHENKSNPSEISIYVEVTDNGIGFPEDYDINEVSSSIELLPEFRHTKVGLQNLHKRLKLFGSEQGIFIKSEPGGKTVVSFKIPAMRVKS
jgi:sensor histidine kinase YesM